MYVADYHLLTVDITTGRSQESAGIESGDYSQTSKEAILFLVASRWLFSSVTGFHMWLKVALKAVAAGIPNCCKLWLIIKLSILLPKDKTMKGTHRARRCHFLRFLTLQPRLVHVNRKSQLLGQFILNSCTRSLKTYILAAFQCDTLTQTLIYHSESRHFTCIIF